MLLTVKNVAGERCNIVCLTNGYTDLGAVFEDNQARFAAGIKHSRQLDKGTIRDLASECHKTVGRVLEQVGYR